MASEQARRENVTDERKIEVKKDRVPKMTSHFESLADQQDVNLRPVHGERVVHQFGQGPLLEEISNLRATAQHNSMEAIRAAEERYHKAQESQTVGTHPHASAQESGVLEEGQQAKYYAAPVSTKGGALKDTGMEKSQQKAPDVLSTKGGAIENIQQAKDDMVKKVPEVKDVLSSKGQSAAQYAAEKAKAAKETTVDASKIAAEFVGEKAAAAKDVTVESGKGAAGYAGKVASGVKDQAVVASWGATHYTLEKVAEVTKAAAGLTSSVTGYAGEKLAAAKDAVMATEEKAADYAARKKAEAKKDLEGKKLSHEQRDEGGESLGSEEQRVTPSEEFKEYFHGSEDGEQKQQQEQGEQKPKQASSDTGTVFQAIGETIVEIGQTTKDLLVGHDYPVQLVGQRKNEKPYTGGGI